MYLQLVYMFLHTFVRKYSKTTKFFFGMRLTYSAAFFCSLLLSLHVSSQTCPTGYELTPSEGSIVTNGDFSVQNWGSYTLRQGTAPNFTYTTGPLGNGGGLSWSGTGAAPDPAAQVGTYNDVSGFWSQARHYQDGTYSDREDHNMYSLMTGTKPANWPFGNALLNAFPGDPANNVAPSQTYLYSNGNVFGSAWAPWNGVQDEYVIWGQTLNNLVIGRRYTFYAYINNAIEPPGNAPDDPIVSLKMGGAPGLPDGNTVAHRDDFTEALTASTQPMGGWVRIAHTFTATQTTEVFKITSAATGLEGDDFQMTQVGVVACRPMLTLAAGTVCATQTIQLTASTPAAGSFTYHWTGPNGFSSNVQNPQISPALLSHNGVYTCTITDANGQTNTKTVTVVVNDCVKPDINAGLVNQPIPGNVKTNDVVPAGTTYGTPVAAPGNPTGTVSITMNPDGTYTFQSDTPGIYTYNVPVCIGGQASPCPTVPLVITVKNPASQVNPPVASTDLATTPLNTPVTIPILLNDGAGNNGGSLNNPAVVSGVNTGATGVVNTNGTFTYTPAPGFVGKDTIIYRVCESPSGLCATSEIIVNVLPDGAANTTAASDDYAYTDSGIPVTGKNVKTNDIDPEGNATTITPQNIIVPGKGTFVLNSDGSYTFTPIAGFSGTVDLPYTICDDGTPQACATATLHIVVVAGNPLYAVFGEIRAVVRNGQLIVNWTTLKEENSAFFEIEVSKDGVNFTKLGEQRSLAANGNSQIEVKYGFTKPVAQALAASLFLFTLLLLPVAGKKRRLFLGGLLLVGILSMQGVSCKKQADTMPGSDETIYVRIVQVDKDGVKQYSKVIEAVQE